MWQLINQSINLLNLPRIYHTQGTQSSHNSIYTPVFPPNSNNCISGRSRHINNYPCLYPSPNCKSICADSSDGTAGSINGSSKHAIPSLSNCSRLNTPFDCSLSFGLKSGLDPLAVQELYFKISFFVGNALIYPKGIAFWFDIVILAQNTLLLLLVVILERNRIILTFYLFCSLRKNYIYFAIYIESPTKKFKLYYFFDYFSIYFQFEFL